MATYFCAEHFNNQIAETINNQMLFGIAGTRGDHAKDTSPPGYTRQIANFSLDI